jgi:hypothetical protein
MTALAVLVVWLALACAVLAFSFRRTLAAAWHEPVLRAPVLILESDDWGYGPLEQAPRLDRLAELLSHFRDALGRAPVTTLGVVLGGPDTERMRAEGWKSYQPMTLADPRLASVREAMRRGASQRVFALQLHGLEHFWPPCLMRAAAGDPSVRAWLESAAFPATEGLPAPLQSRWIDATELPSRPLPAAQATAAAVEETHAFAAVFGVAPEVVVPATFVWNDAVEAGWASAGVGVIVTPGVRNDRRDAEGRVVADGRTYFTAAPGAGGVSYVVRDSYLEPSLGHSHAATLQSLRARTHLGRPTLVEMHRFNFLADEPATERSFEEVNQLLKRACAEFPKLRFMSTAELARGCSERSALVERRTATRVHFLIRRLASVSRLRKLGWATGAAFPALLAYLVTRPRDLAAPAAFP